MSVPLSPQVAWELKHLAWYLACSRFSIYTFCFIDSNSVSSSVKWKWYLIASQKCWEYHLIREKLYKIIGHYIKISSHYYCYHKIFIWLQCARSSQPRTLPIIHVLYLKQSAVSYIAHPHCSISQWLKQERVSPVTKHSFIFRNSVWYLQAMSW